MKKVLPLAKITHDMWALRDKNTGDMIRDFPTKNILLFPTRQDARLEKMHMESVIRVRVIVEDVKFYG